MTADTLPLISLHLRCRCGESFDGDVHPGQMHQVRLNFWRNHQKPTCAPYAAAIARLEPLAPTQIRRRHPEQAVPADDDGDSRLDWRGWLGTCLVSAAGWYGLYRLWAAVVGR